MREIGGNYTTLHNILQPRKGKEVGPTKMGQELGLQVTGSGKYGPLVSPPHPPTPLPQQKLCPTLSRSIKVTANKNVPKQKL